MAGEVSLDVVVSGAAAHVGDAAQHTPGAGRQRGKGVEQYPLRPALPQIVVAQVLRAGAGIQDGCLEPVAGGGWVEAVGGLDLGDRLFVGVLLDRCLAAGT
ncbi:hypothetical protein AS200_03925 [Streptomyces sp. CdTB01]|nr:hypothetical protein AS200_03925 [Streptomyces sp. CdTB01]